MWFEGKENRTPADKTLPQVLMTNIYLNTCKYLVTILVIGIEKKDKGKEFNYISKIQSNI